MQQTSLENSVILKQLFVKRNILFTFSKMSIFFGKPLYFLEKGSFWIKC